MDNLLSAVNGDLVHQHQGRFDILTKIGRECSRLDRVTSATLHLHVQAATNYTPSSSRHYYPRLIAGANKLAIITKNVQIKKHQITPNHTKTDWLRPKQNWIKSLQSFRTKSHPNYTKKHIDYRQKFTNNQTTSNLKKITSKQTHSLPTRHE